MSSCSYCYVDMSLCLQAHTTNITSFLRRHNVLFMSFVTMSYHRRRYVASVNQALANMSCFMGTLYVNVTECAASIKESNGYAFSNGE